MSSHLCPALSAQAKRLVAIRFLIYTGFQSSFFIGVIGTLTYADGASVAFTSAAVLLMNIFVILGSFAGGSALDAWGPRRHYLTNVFGVLVVGCVLAFFGHATMAVLAGAALLGFMIGYSQVAATSYPAYLSSDPAELKAINSVLTTLSNVSIIVGPMLGGFVAAVGSSLAVFPLMMVFAALSLIPGWGFRPQMTSAQSDTAAHEKADGKGRGAHASFAMSIKTVFTNTLLLLLFVIMFLTNFGYGAFDPLESCLLRDVFAGGGGLFGGGCY